MLRLTSPPASEPVTVAEAKAFMRVDFSDDDLLIESLIKVARQQIERYTNRALFTQTWTMTEDELGTVVAIPKPPLASISTIKYYDVDGVGWLIPTDYYYIVKSDDAAKVVLIETESEWPGTDYARFEDGWEIVYVAGPVAYPEWSKVQTLKMVAYMYDNRTIAVPNSLMKDCALYKKWYI